MNKHPTNPTRRSGFTLVEMMISMFVMTVVLSMTMSVFMYSLRLMYKDNQRLATNASLRACMAQMTKQTLDSSILYVFPYYTALDGSVNLATDTSAQAINATSGGYEEGNGDCLVLVTTSIASPKKIRQVRIYYRVTTNQTQMNNDAAVRYYDSGDWGEGAGNTRLYADDTDMQTVLNTINLNANPNLTGSKQINARSRGRKIPASTNLYPIFSTSQPAGTQGDDSTVSVNVEFLNGSNASGTNLLSSSSFNYTISPRR
jgi:prepilin-type N-terminal cleavage/methylation domain-containing protein